MGTCWCGAWRCWGPIPEVAQLGRPRQPAPAAVPNWWSGDWWSVGLTSRIATWARGSVGAEPRRRAVHYVMIAGSDCVSAALIASEKTNKHRTTRGCGCRCRQRTQLRSAAAEDPAVPIRGVGCRCSRGVRLYTYVPGNDPPLTLMPMAKPLLLTCSGTLATRCTGNLTPLPAPHRRLLVLFWGRSHLSCCGTSMGEPDHRAVKSNEREAALSTSRFWPAASTCQD